MQVRGDTSMIKRNNRTIDLQYTGNVKNLPEKLQEKINDFWYKATQENPNLYNGEDYLVDEEIDYTNKLTNLVYGMSYEGNKVARKVIKKFFKKLSYLIED